MKQYKFVNNLTGWITFLIAATVYCLTIEPTASFWDCPEFITTGYKLEVGHPPGAPFFMLVANFFSLFASGPSEVARMVNYMSALMSGACILFLFWSITHLVRKLVVKDENHITRGQMATIMGSGVVGALAYTFSDTFWFSAVEGEVYAFSSLFTAIVFWLILKWEDVADQPHSDRWLILIAYLTGLSIGVHLLNLLCLPAIVLVYYYKKVPNANARGSLLALIGSAVLVAVVLYGIVPGIVKVGGWFELLFVNTLGMPFNTGVIVYIILLAACLIWGVYESYTEKDKMRMAISFVLTIAMLGIPFYGHGAGAVVIGIIVIALLWLYLNPKTQDRLKEKYRVSARTLNTALLCTMMMVPHRHPLHGQHADGPELARRHLHAGRIPGPRAVWHTPAVLRTRLHFEGSPRREGRLLPAAHLVQRHQVHPQREGHTRRERLVHRDTRTRRLRICTEHALPPHVQQHTHPAV